jgi:hypothetical protein
VAVLNTGPSEMGLQNKGFNKAMKENRDQAKVDQDYASEGSEIVAGGSSDEDEDHPIHRFEPLTILVNKQYKKIAR